MNLQRFVPVIRALRGAGIACQAVIRSIRRLFPASHYVLLALLFMVGLELIFALQRWVVIVSLATVAVIAVGIVLVRIEEQGQFRPLYSILPILSAAGFSGFAFLLPTTAVLHVYVAGAGFLFFLLLKHGVRQAYPLWNWALSLAIYFLNVAFVLGLRFYLYLPVLVLLALVALLTALVSFQSLARVVSSPRRIILPTLAMTFVLSEVAWVLQFLPSHYLIQAGILTSLYYVSFSLTSISYMRAISRRDIIEYVGIGVVAMSVILMSTQWI